MPFSSAFTFLVNMRAICWLVEETVSVRTHNSYATAEISNLFFFRQCASLRLLCFLQIFCTARVWNKIIIFVPKKYVGVCDTVMLKANGSGWNSENMEVLKCVCVKYLFITVGRSNKTVQWIVCEEPCLVVVIRIIKWNESYINSVSLKDVMLCNLFFSVWI